MKYIFFVTIDETTTQTYGVGDMPSTRILRPLHLPDENWRAIDGFPSYEVSDRGRIKNVSHSSPWIIALGTKKGGYKLAILRVDGVPIARHVHRLVALAFIPNPDGLPVVHHKDANPSNNLVTNLQWTTQKENISLAMQIRGNWLAGHSSRRKILRIDPGTGEITAFPSIMDAAQSLNVLTVANGGTVRNVRSMAPNICTARDSKRMLYGFYWRSRRSKFTTATQSTTNG